MLVLVSAGNHSHDIELEIERQAARVLSPDDMQANIVKAIAADARHRRLLSPAEAVNVLTVGAIHSDASVGSLPPQTFLDLTLTPVCQVR